MFKWDNFSRLSDSKSVFLFVNENMSWMLMSAISFEMVLLSTQDKLDGFVVDWRIAKENGLTV